MQLALRPGKLTIPAIRGVGGGVIFFIDAKSELAHVWEVEFELVPEDAEPDAGLDARLTRVDHVAQTMNYDDLEALHDLASDLTSRLREAHILYDRDEAGEYFQFYSGSYGEGFFFEIVERRGGIAVTAPPAPRSASPPKAARSLPRACLACRCRGRSG